MSYEKVYQAEIKSLLPFKEVVTNYYTLSKKTSTFFSNNSVKN